MSFKRTAGRGIKCRRISSDYDNVEDIKYKDTVVSCNMAKGTQTYIFVFFLTGTLYCPAVWVYLLF